VSSRQQLCSDPTRAHVTATTPDTERFLTSLRQSHRGTSPYRHWLLSNVLGKDVAAGIAALPFAPPVIEDTQGKRETHNASRVYFDPENQQRFPVCATVAQTLQDPRAIRAIERTCRTDLSGTYLRIEYCQDTGRFWLEPHTDIGVKKFTMLIYLSREPGSENYGTDIYDGPEHCVARAPCQFNGGLIFVPADNTWHGFRPRTITGIRKTVIVNYVTDEWRSRHELAFPDQPIPRREDRVEA